MADVAEAVALLALAVADTAAASSDTFAEFLDAVASFVRDVTDETSLGVTPPSLKNDDMFLILQI